MVVLVLNVEVLDEKKYDDKRKRRIGLDASLTTNKIRWFLLLESPLMGENQEASGRYFGLHGIKTRTGFHRRQANHDAPGWYGCPENDGKVPESDASSTHLLSANCRDATRGERPPS